VEKNGDDGRGAAASRDDDDDDKDDDDDANISRRRRRGSARRIHAARPRAEECAGPARVTTTESVPEVFVSSEGHWSPYDPVRVVNVIP
jgi:hypothetical protein